MAFVVRRGQQGEQRTHETKTTAPLTAPSADFLGLSSRLRIESVIVDDEIGTEQVTKAGRTSSRLVEKFDDAKQKLRGRL